MLTWKKSFPSHISIRSVFTVVTSTTVRLPVGVQIMIGSKILKEITEYKWTFKELMKMEDVIFNIINNMEEPSWEEMLDFLGQEQKNLVKSWWTEKAIFYAKQQMLELIDEAPVMLSQVSQVPPTIEEQKDKIALTKEELKKQIKKDTKVL